MKYIFISICTMVFFSACGDKKKAPEPVATKTDSNTVTLSDVQMKNAGIAVARPTQKDMAAVLRLNGKVDVPPQNMISISVPLGGYLKSTKLLPGMHVRKGDVIAVMQDQQYIQLQQDYLTAKSKISYLENEYKRQKELNQTQASSDKVYQQAEADYRGQRVLITSLGQKLQLAGINVNKISETNVVSGVNIYSPINGFVSKVNVNIGKYVSPTEVLFELINPADIHLALKVFEKDVNQLFIGQQLTAYTNNNPEKKHPCEILLIGKDLSAEGNTDVHCHFEDYDKSLVPGTYMNADIRISNKKTWVLPEDGIVTFENRQYTFVKTAANTFKMIETATGIKEGGFIEIFSTNNTATQEFVVKGAYALLMSLKNKPEEE